MPAAICNSRLRSGSAHWDLELAVEVRLCPLGEEEAAGEEAEEEAEEEEKKSSVKI